MFKSPIFISLIIYVLYTIAMSVKDDSSFVNSSVVVICITLLVLCEKLFSHLKEKTQSISEQLDVVKQDLEGKINKKDESMQKTLTRIEDEVTKLYIGNIKGASTNPHSSNKKLVNF